MNLLNLIAIVTHINDLVPVKQNNNHANMINKLYSV